MAFEWVVYRHVFIINENKARFRIKKHIDIVLFVSILIFKAEVCWLSILKRISLLSFQFIYALSSKKRTQSLAHLVSSTHSVLCMCLACYYLTSDFSVMHFSCSVSAFHTRKKRVLGWLLLQIASWHQWIQLFFFFRLWIELSFRSKKMIGIYYFISRYYSLCVCVCYVLPFYWNSTFLITSTILRCCQHFLSIRFIFAFHHLYHFHFVLILFTVCIVLCVYGEI